MWITLGISCLLGIIYFAVVQFFPVKAVPWMILIGGITFFLLGIFMIFLASHSVLLRIISGIVLITLAILCLYTIWAPERRKALYICSRMMAISAEIVETNWAMLLVIPVFVLFLFGLLVLVGFEILAAWSVG